MVRRSADDWLSQDESETLEFKKSTAELQAAFRTLCGYLNGLGGSVVIGVAPYSKKVAGQHVSDHTLRHIAEAIGRIEPPTRVDQQRITLDRGEKELIVLSVTAQPDAVPFTYEGKAYVRIGSTTSLMRQEQYQDLLLRRMHSLRRWENSPAPESAASALDGEEILRTLRLGAAEGRLPEGTAVDTSDALRRLGLVVDGRVTNAAIVLFGTEFMPSYTQCQVRMARFKGATKAEFLDNRQIFGNAFRLLQDATLFLRRHLPVAGRIEPGLFERVDEPLFPLTALREALVNALCHRDYSQPGGAVSLAIYDDRLEIWSDGTLPFGLRVEDLKRDHVSRPRNPLIAETFFRRGLVERWGRGTQTIVELCVQAGHPEPEFVEQGGAVGVRFPIKSYVPPLRIAHDLTPRQREILHIVSSRGSAPLREIRAAMKDPPSERTVQEDLRLLVRFGLIASGGWGRGAAYRLLARD